MSAALRRHNDGEPLDVGDLPYRLQRALVAARHGVPPADVDAWPATDFYDALIVMGVDV